MNMKENGFEDQEQQELYELTLRAKEAAKTLATLTSSQKNDVLAAMAKQLKTNQAQILEANKKDIEYAKENDLSDAMVDRLLLDEERVDDMVSALHNVMNLADPVGEMGESTLRPNGIRVAKMRIPLGVVLMIYEARPNVAVEAAALTLKSGNVVILRGGKEAWHSNNAIINCWHQAIESCGFSKEMVCIVPSQSHSAVNHLLQFRDTIDLVIPRGGERLIQAVTDNSKIPVIQHFKGVCHLYVDKYADLDKAEKLLKDGKVSRPGVCNSLESLVIHKDIADEFLKRVNALGNEFGIQFKADKDSASKLDNAEVANAEDYHNEYLSLAMSVSQADSYEAAIEHIQNHSSSHTEVIVTKDIDRGNEFVKRINSSVVMVNASSRFSDGGELGLGAEIGISTSKLHAYGPMGLVQLTTEKYVVTGQGQAKHY